MAKKPVKTVSPDTIDVPCQFGGYSDAKKARLRVKIDKNLIPLGRVDRYLCGAQVKATIVVLPAGEVPGQSVMDEVADNPRMEIVADIKNITINADPPSYAFGMSFDATDEQILLLRHKFKGKSGRLIALRVGDAVGGESEDADDDDADGDVPGQLSLAGG